ncbi:hypothetical protein [uncultured Acetobacterium sp.]|nr:hypothetical protein [uncultured Acetobacterium sp.]
MATKIAAGVSRGRVSRVSRGLGIKGGYQGDGSFVQIPHIGMSGTATV